MACLVLVKALRTVEKWSPDRAKLWNRSKVQTFKILSKSTQSFYTCFHRFPYVYHTFSQKLLDHMRYLPPPWHFINILQSAFRSQRKLYHLFLVCLLEISHTILRSHSESQQMPTESKGWLPGVGNVRYEPGYNRSSGTGGAGWNFSSRQIFLEHHSRCHGLRSLLYTTSIFSAPMRKSLNIKSIPLPRRQWCSSLVRIHHTRLVLCRFNPPTCPRHGVRFTWRKSWRFARVCCWYKPSKMCESDSVQVCDCGTRGLSPSIRFLNSSALIRFEMQGVLEIHGILLYFCTRGYIKVEMSGSQPFSPQRIALPHSWPTSPRTSKDLSIGMGKMMDMNVWGCGRRA